MKTAYCPECRATTTWVRRPSLCFWILCLATGGLWLVALPRQALRCRSCGLPWPELVRRSFPLLDAME